MEQSTLPKVENTDKVQGYHRIQNNLSSVFQKEPVYPKIRYYMLVLFAFAGIINQVGWIAFAPLGDILMDVRILYNDK